MFEHAPTVSVIVPTHNRLALLGKCLAMLDAEHASDDFEVIVVDDGSTDGTQQWLHNAASSDVKVVMQMHAGAGRARNAGLREAAGDIVIFIDDDVLVQTGFISAHRAGHAEHPDCAIVGALETILASDDPAVRRNFERAGFRLRSGIGKGDVLTPAGLLTGNVSITRRALDSVGGFDDSLPANEDYDLGRRLNAAGVQIRYWPEAFAIEQFVRGHDLILEGAYRRGIAQGALAADSPDAAHHFGLARYFLGSRGKRIARAVSWRLSPLAPVMLRTMTALMRKPFSGHAMAVRVEHALSGYFYWAGVSRSMRRVARLRDACAGDGT